MSAPLRDWLVQEGAVPATALRAATARQLVYGGALDTALLETNVMTEAAIWARLAAATGLPAPPPALRDGGGGGDTNAAPAFPAARTAAWHAVPIAVDGGAVAWLCAEPIGADAIRAASAEGGLAARLYVVPEVRLLLARQRVYGESIPGRYAPLVARVLGRAPARPRARRTAAAPGAAPLAFSDAAAPTPLGQVLESGAIRAGDPPAQVDVEVDIEGEAGAQPTIPMLDLSDGPVRLEVVSEVPLPRAEAAAEDSAPESAEVAGDTPTEALCRRARDPGDKGRVLALRALRRRLDHPAVGAWLAELRTIARTGGADEAAGAAEMLGQLRDEGAVAPLIERLEATRRATPALASAIHDALVALSAQDFGRSPRRWRAWATRNASVSRIEWLLDGLGHKSPDIRLAAAEDLRQISGDSFGYLFDLPKRERELARRRWETWWREQQARRPTDAAPRPTGGGGGDAGAGDGADAAPQRAAGDPSAPPQDGAPPPPSLPPPPPTPPFPPHPPSAHSPPPPPFPLPPAPKPR